MLRHNASVLRTLYNNFYRNIIYSKNPIGKPRPLRKKNRGDDDVHARKFEEATSDRTTNQQTSRIRYSVRKHNWQEEVSIDLNNLEIVRDQDMETFGLIPTLKHDLEKVLAGGIHTYDYGLGKIPQPNQVKSSVIGSYSPPSADPKLLAKADARKLKYILSTSTISSTLSHLYFILSNFRSPNFDHLSSALEKQPKRYMISVRKPVSLILRKKKEGLYSLDSDKGILLTEQSILSDLGKILENQLTMTQEEFNRRFRLDAEEQQQYKHPGDHHRFMFVNNELCLRSQIDCMSYDQNNKPFVFEIKTRAVSPIRYDLLNWRNFLDYKLNRPKGMFESFEREYYDLIRGAFIKYAFQLRIGSMDGALVAYHNTQNIFGYEFVRTKQINNRIFGNDYNAEMAFLISSKMFTFVLDSILKELENANYEYLRIGFYACNATRKLIVIVEESQDQKIPEPVPVSDQVQDEYDYYTKVKPFKNKVHRYDFKFMLKVNGVPIVDSSFLLEPTDYVEMSCTPNKASDMSFSSYMNFLHEAYKFQKIIGDYTYTGIWVRSTSAFSPKVSSSPLAKNDKDGTIPPADEVLTEKII